MSTRTPDEGRYSKITRRMWNDEKFLELSAAKPNAQTLWMRLLSGPELGIVPGLFAVREGGLADALGWPVAAFRKCWKEIADQEMAEADWRAGLVFVPNGIVHNEPNSTNAILGWRLALKELPECSLKRRGLAALREYCGAKGEAWLKAFDAASADNVSAKPKATPSDTPKPTPLPDPSATPSTAPIPTPSATPSATPSGTATRIQDQEQDTRSGDLTAAGSQDLTGNPPEQATEEAAAATIGVESSDLQRRYELALKNMGAFVLEQGHRRPEFLQVWFAWCKPFGITEGPVIGGRIPRDIYAIAEAFAAGRTLDELLLAGKIAEGDEFMQRQAGGGPATFTSSVLMRLLKPKRAVPAAKARRGGPPQPDHGKTGWEGQDQ